MYSEETPKRRKVRSRTILYPLGAFSFRLLLLHQLLLLRRQLRPILLILNFPPVSGYRLVPARLLDTARERRLARVELVSLPTLRGLERAVGDGHVAPEPLAHVDHAALALAKALLKLSALEGEGVDEGLPETVGGGVALDHDTVGFLETLRERLACDMEARLVMSNGTWK